MNITVEQLKAVGGSEWQKNGMHRVYFHDLAAWLGLDCSYYNTGNISSARINGERISNSQARRLMHAVDKLWFDVLTGKWMFQGDRETATEIIAAIRSKLTPCESNSLPPTTSPMNSESNPA